MNVKIDTKEKFSVICPEAADLSANMTEELEQLLIPYLQKDIPHLVLNMETVSHISMEAAEKIMNIQQRFYEQNSSFVICKLQPAVEKIFEDHEWLEFMNITPSESEAWDMVQMEEIERELLGDG